MRFFKPVMFYYFIYRQFAKLTLQRPEVIEKLKVLSIPILKQDERLSSAASVSRGPDDSSAAALILSPRLY